MLNPKLEFKTENDIQQFLMAEWVVSDYYNRPKGPFRHEILMYHLGQLLQLEKEEINEFFSANKLKAIGQLFNLDGTLKEGHIETEEIKVPLGPAGTQTIRIPKVKVDGTVVSLDSWHEE